MKDEEREFSRKNRVAIVQILMHQKKYEKFEKGAITLAAKQLQQQQIQNNDRIKNLETFFRN